MLAAISAAQDASVQLLETSQRDIVPSGEPVISDNTAQEQKTRGERPLAVLFFWLGGKGGGVMRRCFSASGSEPFLTSLFCR